MVQIGSICRQSKGSLYRYRPANFPRLARMNQPEVCFRHTALPVYTARIKRANKYWLGFAHSRDCFGIGVVLVGMRGNEYIDVQIFWFYKNWQLAIHTERQMCKR